MVFNLTQVVTYCYGQDNQSFPRKKENYYFQEKLKACAFFQVQECAQGMFSNTFSFYENRKPKNKKLVEFWTKVKVRLMNELRREVNILGS